MELSGKDNYHFPSFLLERVKHLSTYQPLYFVLFGSHTLAWKQPSKFGLINCCSENYANFWS